MSILILDKHSLTGCLFFFILLICSGNNGMPNHIKMPKKQWFQNIAFAMRPLTPGIQIAFR